MELQGFVEKPAVDKAPTSLAAVGRYIITPGIMKILATQKPGVGGEVRLSDAFVTHLRNESPIYGRVIDGTRYDCGNKLRFLEAVMDFGLRHEVNAGDKFSEIVLRKAAQIKKAARKRTK
jgi:UTP--glucose-1-phosphate uridylyltransferase